MPNTSFGGGEIDAQDVTVLHIGSLYWNIDGIQVLLGHGARNLLFCPDSIGRLPFHWPAAGPKPDNELTIPENEVGARIIDTLKLLLAADSNIINLQDKRVRRPCIMQSLATPDVALEAVFMQSDIYVTLDQMRA